MKFSSQYSSFLDDTIRKIQLKESERESLKNELVQERSNHDEKMEERFYLKLKKTVSILVSFLFVFSNIFLIALVIIVYFNERDFISSGVLQACDRSINSTVIVTLIGATIAQTGGSFAILIRYFFNSQKES